MKKNNKKRKIKYKYMNENAILLLLQAIINFYY